MRKLSIAYDKQSEPFQTLHWIIKFRNEIAHAKPEPMNKEIEMAEAMYAELCSADGPQSEMEQKITIEHAKKAFDAVTSLQEMIFEKLTDDKKYLVACDFLGNGSDCSIAHLINFVKPANCLVFDERKSL